MLVSTKNFAVMEFFAGRFADGFGVSSFRQGFDQALRRVGLGLSQGGDLVQSFDDPFFQGSSPFSGDDFRAAKDVFREVDGGFY